MLTMEIALSTAKHLASVKGRKQVVAEWVADRPKPDRFVVVPKVHDLRDGWRKCATVDNLGNVAEEES